MPETPNPSEKPKHTPNNRLRRERERRAWSQQDLADEVGTTSLNVGRWERGVTQPNPYFRKKLSEVFGKSAQELGLVFTKEPEETTTPLQVVTPPLSTGQEAHISLWNVPYRRNHFFTGREDILTHLHEALSEQNSPVALAQPQAISGLGGIGKTQTAIEYAYRYRDDYNAVLWARAESSDLLISDFLPLATLLNLPERTDSDQNIVVKAVLRWFDTHDRWLLILDNADDMEVVQEFIPSAGRGHVLLTTRAQAVGTAAERIELDTMSNDEGILFLLRRTKKMKGTTALESVPATIREQAQAIVEAADCLPLALDQAGAYIEETGCSLSDYLKFYKTKRTRLLRMRGKDAAGHPEPVATTWSLSFEKIERAHPAAADLLRLCAFLHPDAIPERMLMEGASELGPVLQPIVEDEFELNEAIGKLLKYSLVKRDAEGKMLSIHRLVQMVIRDGMKENEKRMRAERIVNTLSLAFPDIETELWNRCQQYLSHALNAIAFVQQYNIVTPSAAHLLKQTGNYLRMRAQYVEAERFLQQSIAIYEQEQGPNHVDTAASLHVLGVLYYDQHKYHLAEPLFQQALTIREQQLEQNHLDIADSLSDLAVLYWEQNKYQEAEQLNLRALAIREKHNHSAIAESLNNLGVLYWQLHRFKEAEQAYLRAISLEEKSLGANHPNVATDLNNLAKLYQDQGKYEQAESLNQRALTIFEAVMGPNHPKVADTLGRLGFLYKRKKMYEQAKLLFLRALSIDEQSIEPIGPLIAGTLNNLGQLYYELGQYEQAELFLLRSVKLREQALGETHMYTSISLNSLAKLYQAQGNYEQSESLFRRVLAIREQVLGIEHPDLINVLDAYASLLHKTNRESEAEALESRARAIRARVE